MDQRLQKIFKKPTIVSAYFFGSRAVGKAGPLSDFDFAILFDYKLTQEEREKIHQQIYCELSGELNSDDIDLISLNDTSQPVLLYEAVFHGKALYTRNIEQRAAFEMYVRKLYEDTRHIRRVAAYYQERRIKEGTFGKIIEH